MPSRSTTNGEALALRRTKVRSLLSGIFVQVIGATSQAEAARRIGVTEKTVRRWIKLRTPLDIELVLAAPRIGRRFRELLCIHTHDDFPYVARKRARRSPT
jgi:DNA-binding transcriptional regulator YdaS (Cro superfamily)